MTIHDMDLSELATYFESESKRENIWESVTHDWMIENINLLGTSLQQYVQAFYHLRPGRQRPHRLPGPHVHGSANLYLLPGGDLG